MDMKKLWSAIGGMLLLLASASSVSGPSVLALSELKISGFMSAVGSISNNETSYSRTAQINDEIDFGRETMLGLQIDAKLMDKLIFTTQLLADRDPDNYSLQADWIFAKYTFNQVSSIKAGRIRSPVFMVSEFIEVGITYPWVRPPAEVYGLLPLNSVNGVEFRMNVPVLDSNLYLQGVMGNSELDTSLVSISGKSRISANKVLGVNALWSTDNHNFRIGYIISRLDIFDTALATLQNLFAAGDLSGTAPLLIEALRFEFITLGMDFSFGNISGMLEHVRRKVGEPINAKQYGSYLMLQYALGKYHPHITYAIADSIGFSSINADQKSVTVGVKYELSYSAVLKLDYLHIGSLKETPGFFLSAPTEKDSASIVSVALDLVF